MPQTVNIEVYCSMENGEKDVFAVLSEHRPDLPKPFDKPLQEWAESTYSHMEPGESIERAGKMVYKSDSDIVEFRI